MFVAVSYGPKQKTLEDQHNHHDDRPGNEGIAEEMATKQNPVERDQRNDAQQRECGDHSKPPGNDEQQCEEREGGGALT